MNQLQHTAIKTVNQPFLHPLTRIMSLDDDNIDQMACKRVIDHSGIAIELVSFTMPSAALLYFENPESPPIDLILLDVNMPCMNGFEFLAAAQDLMAGRKLPPVLVTLGNPLGPIHKQQAEMLSMIKGYLYKPLKQHDLEFAVQSIQTLAAASGQNDPAFDPARAGRLGQAIRQRIGSIAPNKLKKGSIPI